MRITTNNLLSVLICTLLSILSLSSYSYSQYVPGEVLVKYKNSAEPSSINSLHSAIGSSRKKDFRRARIQQVKLSDSMSVEEAVRLYKMDPNVEYAEPNYIVRANALPDDSSFSQLWGLHNTGQSVNGSSGTADADIDAPEAWDLENGSTNPVVIAVIDSGVAYNHPDLNPNIWTNTGETSCIDGIDNDSNGYIDDCNGWDFIGNDNDPRDYFDGIGHGTHVAGTIAAAGNNASGITGVMWQAQIMPLRFLGMFGTGDIASAIEAIEYANDNGAHIINNSWGGTRFSQALKDVIDVSNAVVVCAAGNSGLDNDSSPHYPASYSSSNIISVAATTQRDVLASFSNYGLSTVDVAAPGTNIYSTIPVHTYGTSVPVYPSSGGVDNFDSQTGPLPTSGDLLSWRKAGPNATWEITGGTGTGGSNSLEDSPGANYVNNTNAVAFHTSRITPVSDNIYSLSFQWKGNLEEDFDYLDIKYSIDLSAWYWIENDETPATDDYVSLTGSSSGQFLTFSTDQLTKVTEFVDGFYFGLGLWADSDITEDGVYIDNISLTRRPIVISNYNYDHYQGTSMATPHVAGIAGLIKAMNPSLTNMQIKNAILNSVEIKNSVECKVATGGRVNAYNALLVAQGDPSGLTSGVPDCVNPDDNQPVTASSGGGGGGGGCFIATAAYGSIMHPHVQDLREFRDEYFLDNYIGKAFVSIYYKYSPPLADIIRNNESLRFITRVTLTPLVMLVAFPYASSFLIISLLSASIGIIRYIRIQKRSKYIT